MTENAIAIEDLQVTYRMAYGIAIDQLVVQIATLQSQNKMLLSSIRQLEAERKIAKESPLSPDAAQIASEGKEIIGNKKATIWDGSE